MKNIYLGLIGIALLSLSFPIRAETTPTITKHAFEITAEKMPDGSTRYHSRMLSIPQTDGKGQNKSVESLFSYTPQECTQDPNSCRPLKDFIKSLTPQQAPGYVD